MTAEKRKETTLQRLTNRIGEISKRLPAFAQRKAILWPANLGNIECAAIRRDLQELHELRGRVHALDVEAGVSVEPGPEPLSPLGLRVERDRAAQRLQDAIAGDRSSTIIDASRIAVQRLDERIERLQPLGPTRRQEIARRQWRDMTPADRFDFLTWALREDTLAVFEQASAAHGYRLLLESDLREGGG